MMAEAPVVSAVNSSSPIFATAGKTKQLTVLAVSANNIISNNYGKEATAEPVDITFSQLIAPAGGVNGAWGCAPAVVAASGFTLDCDWSEVGIPEVSAGLDDGHYKGVPVVPSLYTLGRFIPDHFAISASLINRTDANTQSCSSSSFTFLDEQLTISFDVEAQNESNGLTENYDGSFAKLDGSLALGSASGSDQGSINVVAEHLGAVYYPGSRISGTGPLALMANGQQTGATFQISLDRNRTAGNLSAETPLVGIQFAINPI